MILYTVDDLNVLEERIRITYGLGSDHSGRDYAPPHATGVTKVSISHGGNVPAGTGFIPNTQAVAMLNLGENHSAWNGASGAFTPYYAGARTWMDVGTYYNFDTDNMYVGLKDDGGNAKDAVINWGDDPQYTPDLSDHLLFIFTQVNGAGGQSGAEDGLEVARMTGTGHMGIGNFSNPSYGNGSGFKPARRLEIYDEHFLDGLADAPQLRLSYSPANPTNLLTTGIWTDFQTQASGDLIITPDNTGVDQKVGIGTSSVNATYPLTTLHIADNNVNGTGEITTDALKHTYSATTPSGNPWLVYSDLNGTLKNLAAAANSTDVLYGNGTWAPPGGGISIVGADNGCSLDAATGTLVELGQDIGGSGAYLINDREIPQNNFDIYFTEAASHLDDLHNNVAMGNLYPLVPDAARLTVEKTIIANINVAKAGEFTATSQYNNQTAQAYAVIGIATQTTPTGGTIQGGQFQGIGSTKKGTYGVYGYGKRPDLVGPVWGGYFEAVGAPGGPMPPVAFAYGVEGRAQTKVAGTAHYAVYGNLGVACPTWPPVACPTAPAFDYAGYFNGDVLSTTNIFLASDATLKDNIQDITNPMDIINQLNPKSYTFKRDQNPSMQLSDSTHYGILAQELEGILPQLVKNSIHPPVTDSAGNVIYAPVDFKAVNYIELIPFLIAGMKEQQQTIEAMQAQLSNCCSGGNRNSNTGGEHGNSTSLDVELKNAKSIILNQNVPNPFAEQTTITYFLTDDVKKAQMFFYDNKGTILKTVDLNETGAGQINVFAADLSSGNYTYTLVANGKVIDSKKMLKTQ